MNLRWLIFDYVDPELHLTRAQRGAVRRRAWDLTLRPTSNPKPLKNRTFLDDLAHEQGIRPRDQAIAMVPMMIWMLVPTAWILFVGFDGLVSIMLLWPLYLTGLWFCVAFAGRRTWRPAVVRALREQGHPICPRCGYQLEGLDGENPQCPECGERPDPPINDAIGRETP